MSFKSTIWIGIFVGSLIGGYLPVLFGASIFSFWSVLGNGIGGLIGIWIAYKVSDEH